MTFLVVDTPSPYNAIIGHPGLKAMKVIVSTRYLLVKFSIKFGMGQIIGDQKAVRRCYQTATKNKGKGKALHITNAKLRGCGASAFRRRQFRQGIPDWFSAGKVEKKELITFLKDNKDVFA
ncbi:hypothetical protein CFOL_v3_05104 [Cephalotus follicularis]|uniref:Uncharacterized protein n=1 Tax=Cephalotus follicularis TaxID=3775 RepID=A0A1Q3B0Q5_CEPFO|nr:hypothetical protein CFOL_v3_05104 [Cephalotus follicularis]